MQTGLDTLDPVAQRRMLGAPGPLTYLPWALLYPWRGLAWLTVAALACGLWAMSYSAGSAVYTLGFLGVTLQYFFSVLSRTIDGRATPPRIAGVISADAESTRFQGACALVVTGGVLLGEWAHPAAERVWLVLAVAALPASAVNIALGGNLLTAADPRRLWPVMLAGGRWYLVLTALVVAGLWAGGPRFGLFTVEPDEPVPVRPRVLDGAGLLWTLLAAYLAVVWAHLLGFIVHRAHDDLGLHVSLRAESEAERERAQVERATQRILPAVFARWDAGDQAGAARQLETLPLLRGMEHAHLEAVFDACLARRGHGLLVAAVGRRLIADRLRHARPGRALEVALACLDRVPGFTAAKVDQQVLLVREARRQGLDAAADRLVANAVADAPDAAGLFT